MVGLTFSVRWVEWVGGWLEIWRVKLISTEVLVEVEVGVELGNSKNNNNNTSLRECQLTFTTKNIKIIGL